MNTNILKKCLDELNKETPDISYIRGMIETLSEMNNETIPANNYTPSPVATPKVETISTQPEEVPESYGAGSYVEQPGPVAPLH